MKRVAFWISLFFLLSSCSSVKNTKTTENIPPPSKGCFAPCIKNQIPDKDSPKYPVYTGIDETVGLDTLHIETMPARTEWVKKKADKNCKSADPEDCLVWCLVEVPAQYELITLVKDTSKTSAFKMVSKSSFSADTNTKFTCEVICAEKVTNEFIHQVQIKLVEQGFDAGMDSGGANKKFQKALEQFQKDNYLPIGQLDFETLDVLGVEY